MAHFAFKLVLAVGIAMTGTTVFVSDADAGKRGYKRYSGSGSLNYSRSRSRYKSRRGYGYRSRRGYNSGGFLVQIPSAYLDGHHANEGRPPAKAGDYGIDGKPWRGGPKIINVPDALKGKNSRTTKN